MGLANHHKRTPYALISPYMHEIAPFVVARMCTHPGLLKEICNFLSKEPADLISVTLPRTLPSLFANCELRVLQEIAKDLGTKLSYLFLNHPHQILAHVFLLHSSKQTERALSFIVKYLVQDTGQNGTIDTHSIIHSCLVPLLVELVIVMGSEDKAQAEMVGYSHYMTLRALWTVQL
jgi:serine/threonine-protein kinase ATR